MTSFLNKMNDEGDYSISLVEVMRKNPSLNSREILMPVIEKIPFRKQVFPDQGSEPCKFDRNCRAKIIDNLCRYIKCRLV
ncbi:Fe-only nitrogenase accessory AnfO family protein [Zymomonas mobilis]|uniref:Fe-only nitrogenase accessory AnfO family protein n=1 Tax=Zymomonas mobilis TaxID=542 RepID=UPI00338EB44B